MSNSQDLQDQPAAANHSRAPIVYLTLMLLFHLSVNLWWLAADRHPIGADAALHLQFAEQYYDAMTSDDHATVGERFEAARNIRTIYPPILHILGALTWLVLPYNTDAMVFVNTLALLALIAGVYCFARSFLSRWQALFAAFIASFTPFLFGGSRFFLQDLMAATVVVWAMWALVKTDLFRNTRWVFVFAFICAIGVLVRWTTPVYYAAPAALAILGGIVQSIRTKPESGESADLGRAVVNLFIIVALPAVLMAPWYVNNLDVMRDTYERVFKDTQGSLDFSNWHDWTIYLLYIINTGTFLPLFAVAALGLPFALLRRRVPMPAALTVLWLLGSYFILTLAWSFKSPAPRYILPMLPPMAILAAVALTSLPGRPTRIVVATAFSAFLVFQFSNLTFVSFGSLSEIQVPWFSDHRHMVRTEKEGLIVYSDKVFASSSKYFPAFRGENWQTRVFDAMAQHDREAQYVTAPMANYESLRISKVDVERMQRRYRPLRNADPRRPTRDYVGPLVNVTSAVQEEGASLSVVSGAGSEYSVGGLGLFGNALLMPDGKEVVVNFAAAVTLDALDYVLPPNTEGRFYGVRVEYQPAGSETFQDFSPPVYADMFLSSRRYFSFDSVEARRLRIVPLGESRLMESSIVLYRKEIQARPFVLNASGEEMEDLARYYPITDYIVATDMTDDEFALISEDFERIDSFTANFVTHWRPREFSVLARKHLQPILYNTEPRLRVSLSDVPPESTRLARPWWRVPEVDRVVTPEGELINWLVPYPAVADMDLGRAYEIRAIDIVPSRPMTPIGIMAIQYWDAASGRWTGLSEEQPFTTGTPKYNAHVDRNTYAVRTPPIEWVKPVATNRLRLTFMGGSIASQLLLANVFVYGEPTAEADSGAAQTPAEAAQKIFARTDGVITQFAGGPGSDGPKHYGWAMPALGAGDLVFEFKAISQGLGTVRLAIDGNPSIIFPNMRGAYGLWALGEHTLAYRADDGQPSGVGTFRLVVPEGAERGAGDTLNLSVLLVANQSDSASTIAIRKVQ